MSLQASDAAAAAVSVAPRYRPGSPEHPPAPAGGQPCAAIIAHVINSRRVNLHVIDERGISYGRVAVTLLQDNDKPPQSGGYAEWMPFQKGQAGKTEQLEQQQRAR